MQLNCSAESVNVVASAVCEFTAVSSSVSGSSSALECATILRKCC